MIQWINLLNTDPFLINVIPLIDFHGIAEKWNSFQ